MEFKTPLSKRRSVNNNTFENGLFNSTLEAKKMRISSETAGSKENDVYFDDNFSQYFHTQFVRQISEVEQSFQRSCSTPRTDKDLLASGFSQTLNESQFEDSMPLGQRFVCNETLMPPSSQWRMAQPSKRPLNLNATVCSDDCDKEGDGEKGEKPSLFQSSQVFLHEISMLQSHIESIIDRTLMVNKSHCSDDVDDKFNVFKSNFTQCEYIQMKRSKQETNNISKSVSVEKQCTFINDESQLLADFVKKEEEQQDTSSIINQTVMTNKSNCSDGNNDAHNRLRNVNQREYIQIQQEPDEISNSIFSETEWAIDNNENKLLADFVEKEEEQEALNECVHASVIESLLIDDAVIRDLQSPFPHRDMAAVGVSKTAISSTVKPVTASNFCILGPFFGLPVKVKALIKDFKGIDDLYDWQKECLQLPAVDNRQNLIYALPTSGGKTLVSEILILRELMCRKKNCLFVLPYVSIVQEKIWALSPFGLHLEFLVEEYAAGKGSLPPQKRRKKNSVYIATIEKALALFDSLIETNRTNEIGLVIVDELHIVGEVGRGAVLEALLTKIQYIKAGIQVVGMSATIGNLRELAEFLSADIYHKDFRPVELREYIKCGADLLEVKKDAIDIESAFVHARTVNFSYNDEVTKMDPDHIAGLVSEVIPEKSCLIFCPSKKNCENLAILLCKILSIKYRQHKISEKENLIKAIESDMSSRICPILSKTIPYGIAYHHSGLTADERRHLEEAFRQGILCVICCTSTLAAGVNLPAKRVIIRSPYVGREFITLSKYKQMVGRAGRAGFNESGESILICSALDNIRVTELLCSPMDEVCSQMIDSDKQAIGSLVLSAIGLNLAATRADLQKLLAHTLLKVQETRIGVNISEEVNEILAKLIKSKAIQPKDTDSNKSKNSSVEIELDSSTLQDPHSTKMIQLSQKVVVLKPSTQLEVSQMGKASFKSGINLVRSKVVHSDLEKAQRSLVLVDYLHLLYIVTPMDDNAPAIDASIFYSKYSSLTSNQQHTANVIGITESVAFKVASGRSLKPELERVVKKFFFTMVLNELWQLKPITDVANSFKIDRGLVQNLTGMSAIEASCLLKFCEELEEFWALRELLKNLSQRLSHICTVELVPLMLLPCVKLGRAKQLYNAGYKTVEDVARAKPKELISNIEHMSNRIANQLISAAKMLVLEKLENLREEVQECYNICIGAN